MKVVIIEDEIRIREGVCKLLKKLSKEYMIVGQAENGLEGIAIIKAEQPELVITDIRMPRMDGLEMLRELYEDGYKFKTIILSAYSEFEYARKAIQLGVTEYLLKPIVVREFTKAVEHVEKQIKKELNYVPVQLGDINQVLKHILTGDLDINDEIVNYLSANYNLQKDMNFAIFTESYETWDEKNEKEIGTFVSGMMTRSDVRNCLIEDRKEKKRYLFFYGYGDLKGYKHYLQNCYLRMRKAGGTSRSWTAASGLEEILAQYEKMEHYLEWNITLGDEIIISYPEILNVQTSVCIYPNTIENKIKAGLCEKNEKKVDQGIKEFHSAFREKNVFEPSKIKECYVRLCWAIIKCAREMMMLKEDEDIQNLLKKIMETRTQYGIEKNMRELQGMILMSAESEIVSITVKKMLDMIHESYSRGVMLYEIADRLGLTSEYLGTQFHKEMHVTFSVYMKQYRIRKAKELLVSTKLKLYQIAEKVGYSDPKYFSKVFKEVTGELPAEYRKSSQ